MDTWNPITGCLHNCLYCWARNYAERLKISDMGDMWGEWVPKEWIKKVLETLRTKTETSFLFLTKNPKRYHEFMGEFTENMVLGATIETNREYNVTKAPSPRERFAAMKTLNWDHKAVVVEPILDFDFEFVDWIKEIRPEIVYVGYDNYDNRLPEPRLRKAWKFVNELRKTMDRPRVPQLVRGTS